MVETLHKPRVALLGAGLLELELLGDLQRGGRVDWAGVYDPDPRAPGLGVAEVLGIPAGHDETARERLRQAEFVVLPHDRQARREAVQWASGLRVELVGLEEARRRWGGTGAASPLASGGSARSEEELRHLEEASLRLQEKAELADWLLGIAMRAVGATGGSIQILAPDTSELYLVAAHGLSERVVRRARHGVGEPISGLVAATRQTKVMEGPQASGRAHDRGPITASVCLPLEDAGELVGVLNLSSSLAGKRFTSVHLETLQRLAPRLATLLRRAQHLDDAAARGLDSQLPRFLRELEARKLVLRAFLGALAEHLCAVLDADAVSVYVSTQEGDWLHLGGAERGSQPPGPDRTRYEAVGRAFLEQRWLHQSTAEPDQLAPPASEEPPAPRVLDAVDLAVERVFATGAGGAGVSRVYAPLTGIEPLGVLVVRFGNLEAAERFVQHGEPLAQQVALYLEARVRERHQSLRVQRLARLARLVPRLFELQESEALDAEIARQAAQLVGARRALVRRVDEVHRTYSRPVAFGIDAAELEVWRRVDSRVSERTLQDRRAVLTATVQTERERLDEIPAYRSSISVPLLHRDALVGIVNVYDKEPLDPLDGSTFTNADRELLESLALVAVLPFAGRRGPGAGPKVVPPPPPEAAAVEAPHSDVPSSAGPPPRAVPVVEAPPLAPDEPPPAPEIAFAELSRVRLTEALGHELERAARYHHGVGVTLLRLADLVARAGDAAPEIHAEMASAVQQSVRSSDLVGWLGPDDLVVVSPESHARSRALEDRLVQVLQVHLERLAVAAGDLQVLVGSSAYPRDGQDLRALLETAAERLR